MELAALQAMQIHVMEDMLYFSVGSVGSLWPLVCCWQLVAFVGCLWPLCVEGLLVAFVYVLATCGLCDVAVLVVLVLDEVPPRACGSAARGSCQDAEGGNGVEGDVVRETNRM